MKRYLDPVATFLLGHETRELFDEPNPLRGVDLADIHIRAQALIDSNLDDEANYIRQAVIIVSSEHQWRDDRLKRRALIHTFKTNDGQKTFEEVGAELDAGAFKSKDGGHVYTEVRHGNENTPAIGSQDSAVYREPLKRTDDLRFERDFKHARIWQRLWHQSRPMKWLMLLCGIGAMVQGWDEAAVNGAQVYYRKAYGLGDDSIYRIGLINGAPYLCCFISCWLSWPLNKWLGRKNTIALSAFFSMAFALAQGFANDWKTMFVLRFCMGFGIGPKSATIPIYASEIAPADLRGSLVMIWQLFTALGIMLGYLAGVAFTDVLDGNAMLRGDQPCSTEGSWLSIDCSLNWRLMIASPFVAPAFLMVFIFFAPESPRWLIARAQREQQAIRDNARMNEGQAGFEQSDLPSVDLSRVFRSLNDLRDSKIKAARDILIIDVLLSEQRKRWEQTANTLSSKYWFTKHKKGRELHRAWNELYSLFSNTRDFSALRASTILMFLQQYCGINVLIYYSTLVIFDSGNGSDNPIKFLGMSAGVGLLNFVCGLPAILLIDRVGRRKLLLWTFPFLALFEIFVGIGMVESLKDRIDTSGLVLCGMYLFVVAYSSGEGPVPFVYASESFQQATRDLGMGVVTSINWAFNFLVAFTFPLMRDSVMTSKGTFWFYGGWCIAGFFLILLFVPETCKLELEQLDEVFSKTWRQLAKEHWRDFWGPRAPRAQDRYGGVYDTANRRFENRVNSHKYTAQASGPPSKSDSQSFLDHGAELHEMNSLRDSRV